MSREDKPSYPLLDTIASPDDLKALSLEECAVLAEEIRQFIIEAVTTGGSGHLGSNLGAVEITLAMHRVFTSPRDVLLFDTGHQAYVHKLVTGRHAGFALLRREGGSRVTRTGPSPSTTGSRTPTLRRRSATPSGSPRRSR